MTDRRSTIRRLLQDGAASLFPGYFALVMATGALSVAGHLLGFGWLAWPLLAAGSRRPWPRQAPTTRPRTRRCWSACREHAGGRLLRDML